MLAITASSLQTCCTRNRPSNTFTTIHIALLMPVLAPRFCAHFTQYAEPSVLLV